MGQEGRTIGEVAGHEINLEIEGVQDKKKLSQLLIKSMIKAEVCKFSAKLDSYVTGLSKTHHNMLGHI